MNSFFKQYKVLVIFVGLTLIGIVIRYGAGEDSFIWKVWSVVDVSLAVSLGVLAFFAYHDMVKDEDEIKLYFKLPNDEVFDTGLTLLRRNFTRSEIMGLLGMIQKNPKERFDIESLQNLNFLKEIHHLQKGSDMQFFINLGDKEVDQFKVNR